MLVRDLPVPPGELQAWTDHLWPAGFRGGLAAGLFAGDGRHLGFLSLLTDAADRPAEAERRIIGLLTPLIAHAVDRMRTAAAAASIVRDAVGGVVLTRGGEALALPGLPPHPLLVRRCAGAARSGGPAEQRRQPRHLPLPGQGRPCRDRCLSA